MTKKKSDTKTPKKKAINPPLQFAEDFVAWAAWLYYVEKETQEATAKKLGVSRASVANYINEAKERGLIEVKVKTELLSSGEMSKQIKRKFALDDVFVIPKTIDNESQQTLNERIAVNGGKILQYLLKEGQTLGIAWGRTMIDIGRMMPHKPISGVTVMQISGSMVNEKNSSPEFCTAMIANALKAKSLNISAPSIVSTPELCKQLMQEPIIKQYMAQLKTCDMAVFGIGAFEEAKDLGDVLIANQSILDAYAKKGAVGILVGRFINQKGETIKGPLQSRQIGISLSTLKNIPCRLLIGSGEYKAKAIKAALTGGFCTHLVVDYETANKLLSID